MASNNCSNVVAVGGGIICLSQTGGGTSSWSKPYPPGVRDGVVDEHDKPFFYYGHLGRVYWIFRIVSCGFFLRISIF